ncbi:hypothetical protein LXL04_006314 [Taraxacum kok-saghyz]
MTSTPTTSTPTRPPLRYDLHSDDLDDQLHVSVSLQDLSRCRCVPPRPLLSLSDAAFLRRRLPQHGNIGGQLQIFICIVGAHHIGAARQHISIQIKS